MVISSAITSMTGCKFEGVYDR